MTTLLATTHYLPHPYIDWATISPLIACWWARSSCCWSGCSATGPRASAGTPVLALVTLVLTIVLTIARFHQQRTARGGRAARR